MSVILFAVLGGLLLLVILLVVLLVLVARLAAGSGKAGPEGLREMERIRRELLEEARATRSETAQLVQSSVKSMGGVLAEAHRQSAGVQNTRLAELNAQLSQQQETLRKTVGDSLAQIGERLSLSARESEDKLNNIRATVENRLTAMQEDNGRRLDQMRATVDEKLQKTLEERIGQSFKLVSDRLDQVYKGLGEMQTLAAGVGDLKKVLSNVKTRGVLGEIQLGAILQEILAPEQYAVNVATKKGSANVVEYAVKLPGDGGETVYLPIDAKFPADAYTQLLDAYDTGDKTLVEAAASTLESRLRRFAKDIHDKYIDPPATTEFGILFLPFEGLYAEVVRRGMVEKLQRDFQVSIAGPTTMAALLNSFQMGFRTLAIQKRSSEVWSVLGAVKTEFEKFGNTLTAAQQRLEQANNELDRLVGVRTRQIQRKLSTVTALPEDESARILDAGDTFDSAAADAARDDA